MLFDGVLLASDYDGTLVPSDKQVTEGVKKALAFFIANGGRFTVSTGRTYLGFHSYSNEYINAPVLLANGGMAYDYEAKKIAVFDGIGDEGVEPMRGVAREFPQLAIELYPFDKGFAVNLSAQSERHFTSQSIPFEPIGDPSDAPRPWAKAMLGGAKEDIARVQTFLAEKYPEISFIPTDGGYLEVLKKGVNKGTALLKLADYLGIDHRHAYAVGDGYNDVDMLKAARLAFVPANGDEYARACADRIVRSNEEDAVAHVIELLTERYRKERAE